MPDVKCCSDTIKPPQNLSSMLKSPDRLRGHQSRGWSAPSADTGEQWQGCPLHQGVSVQAWRNSMRKRFNFYSLTPPWALLRVVIGTRQRQKWKTLLSDIVRGPEKLFRSHHRKTYKVLSHWQGEERDTRNNPQSFFRAKSDAFLPLSVQLKSFDVCIQNWENDWLEAFPPAMPSSISS